MKGITKKLRDLEPDSPTFITGSERSDIYKIASRLKIRVSVKKGGGGFYVTMKGYRKRPLAPVTFTTGYQETKQVEEDFDFGA